MYRFIQVLNYYIPTETLKIKLVLFNCSHCDNVCDPCNSSDNIISIRKFQKYCISSIQEWLQIFLTWQLHFAKIYHNITTQTPPYNLYNKIQYRTEVHIHE